VAAPTKLRKVILGIAIALVLLLLVLAFALWMKPPEILRVGANYAAKIVCSNVFLAGRDLLLRRLLRTVGRITKTAGDIGTGALDRRLGDQGIDDEVGQLATTFDSMLERIDTAMTTQRRLLSDVSHQLRTPLTVARGHLEVLYHTGDIADPTAVAETVTLVLDELDHMRSLVERLLLLGRAMEPDFLSPDLIDARAFLADLHSACQVLAPRHWLLAAIPDVVVSADVAKLRGALLNLVDNAVKYAGDGGEVSVRLRRAPGAVQLVVSDHGVGIAPEEQQRIFERFYRATAARARKDFGESDRIRDQLAAMGVVIKDSKEGTTWEIAR